MKMVKKDVQPIYSTTEFIPHTHALPRGICIQHALQMSKPMHKNYRNIMDNQSRFLFSLSDRESAACSIWIICVSQMFKVCSETRGFFSGVHNRLYQILLSLPMGSKALFLLVISPSVYIIEFSVVTVDFIYFV